MKIKVSTGSIDMWVLTPSIVWDNHFKQIGFVWLKWCLDIRFKQEEE